MILTFVNIFIIYKIEALFLIVSNDNAVKFCLIFIFNKKIYIDLEVVNISHKIIKYSGPCTQVLIIKLNQSCV